MAIYNRWGDPVEIIACMGKVSADGFNTPVTLVKVRYGPGAEDRYQFSEFLKADNGTKEIADAVSALPVSTITQKAKQKAIQQAM